MERIKLKFCKAFLALTQTTTDTWSRYIEEVEPNVRRCYSDTLEINPEELVKIIFLDSGFILHLFCSCYYFDFSDELSLLAPWLDHNIRLDLLLLENQLPFFVLDRLFDLSYRARFPNGPPFLELTFAYFNHYNRSELKSDNNINIRHFTDMLRTFHLQHPPERRPPRKPDLLRHLPSATQLSEAGVRFKKADSKCLLALRFSRGVLEIPELKVEDGTEVLFRNMVALEQHHYPNESYITDYVFVLDFLVNTGKDVDILVRKKVMGNWLGDTDTVANMFNNLLNSVVQLNFNSHYFNLGQDVNAFVSNPCRNLKLTLSRDYCKSPWQTAASIAAIFLLFLALVQSVCSVLQTIKH